MTKKTINSINNVINNIILPDGTALQHNNNILHNHTLMKEKYLQYVDTVANDFINDAVLSLEDEEHLTLYPSSRSMKICYKIKDLLEDTKRFMFYQQSGFMKDAAWLLQGLVFGIDANGSIHGGQWIFLKTKDKELAIERKNLFLKKGFDVIDEVNALKDDFKNQIKSITFENEHTNDLLKQKEQFEATINNLKDRLKNVDLIDSSFNFNRWFNENAPY